MQTSSTAYKKQMADLVRPRQYMEFVIQVIDTTAAGDAVFTDNGHLHYSMVDNLAYDHVPVHTYATLEPNRWRCDGSQLVPSHDEIVEQGFVSSVLSASNGVFGTPPKLHVDFTKEHIFPGVTLVFDPSCDDYPAEVVVVGYRSGREVKRVVSQPDKPMFAVVPDDREGFYQVDSLDILVTNSGKDRRRARIQYVIFGYLVTPSNDELTSATVTWESDPLSRTLPNEKLRFTILNHEGLYNPDNPKGIWRDMEERIPVIARFGQTIDAPVNWSEVNDSDWSYIFKNTWKDLYEGGFVEYLPLGLFYLDSLPSTSGRSASFSAVSIVGILDNEYYKGRLGGGTLYDLAIEVLQDAPIPKLPDGNAPWYVWEGLKNIRTAAPLPIMTARELLQLIANAGCCLIHTDRDGVLRIEPLPSEQHEDFVVDFDSMLDLPDCDKVAALGGVNTNIYSYSNLKEFSEVYNDTIKAEAGETVHIQLTWPTRNIKVEIQGARFTYTAYAQALDIKFESAGTYEVVVSGEEIEAAVSVISNEVEDARETSAWASIDNQLITSKEVGRAVAAWTKEYLLLRNTYSFRYKGNPEVEALDVITMQSQFTPNMPAYVLKNQIDFNGAIWGSMILKKVDKG